MAPRCASSPPHGGGRHAILVVCPPDPWCRPGLIPTFSVRPCGFVWARRVAVAAGLAASTMAGARAQSAPQAPTPPESASAQFGTVGIRPEHLWSADYASLVVGDTVGIFTAPARWDGEQWLEAAEAVSAVGATAAFDGRIRRSVQAHRTTGEDRFMRQWQEFGNYYAFGALAAFDALAMTCSSSSSQKVGI